ncbi:hypothetical protein MKQ70_19905 [Chitinophaga sedimenti]|uniref:hypothetical protein n=1 Tax=Chitinophaga sedimenti TaxID=2033606 RepID=UPI002004A416|nr:hypothetical protein [Chitinophaga sedimenti]MCK7557146.1 hypothetical protein [Chitinophaga sedimenti]
MTAINTAGDYRIGLPAGAPSPQIIVVYDGYQTGVVMGCLILLVPANKPDKS